MRFLIDANLPRAAIVVCQKFGHQVEFARDIGLAAALDAQITRGQACDCRSGPGSLPSPVDFRSRRHNKVAKTNCDILARSAIVDVRKQNMAWLGSSQD